MSSLQGLKVGDKIAVEHRSGWHPNIVTRYRILTITEVKKTTVIAKGPGCSEGRSWRISTGSAHSHSLGDAVPCTPEIEAIEARMAEEKGRKDREARRLYKWRNDATDAIAELSRSVNARSFVISPSGPADPEMLAELQALAAKWRLK